MTDLSRTQRLARKTVSEETFRAMEAESREWKIECPKCGHTTDYWSVGGIRYKARSKGKVMIGRCRNCRRWRLFRIFRQTGYE